MGAIWLLNMPDWLRDAGLDVSTWPGWETRSRSTGGYEDVRGIGIHHDAAPESTSLEARCRYGWESAEYRPVGAIRLHFDGRVVVGAAGATNTQGRGGPVETSKGTIPLNEGNKYMVSIEASNNGIGQVWPEVQLDAYRVMCKTLCDRLGLDPMQDIFAHFEWAPDRKIDPAGPPSPYGRLLDRYIRWDMDAFRTDTAHVGGSKLIPADTLEMLSPSGERILDTRRGDGRFDDETRTISVPGGSGKVGIQATITVADARTYGHVTAWASGPKPNISCLNFDPARNVANTTTIPISSNSTFNLAVKGEAHVIVDLIGYWAG